MTYWKKMKNFLAALGFTKEEIKEKMELEWCPHFENTFIFSVFCTTVIFVGDEISDQRNCLAKNFLDRWRYDKNFRKDAAKLLGVSLPCSVFLDTNLDVIPDKSLHAPPHEQPMVSTDNNKNEMMASELFIQSERAQSHTVSCILVKSLACAMASSGYQAADPSIPADPPAVKTPPAQETSASLAEPVPETKKKTKLEELKEFLATMNPPCEIECTLWGRTATIECTSLDLSFTTKMGPEDDPYEHAALRILTYLQTWRARFVFPVVAPVPAPPKPVVKPVLQYVVTEPLDSGMKDVIEEVIHGAIFIEQKSSEPLIVFLMQALSQMHSTLCHLGNDDDVFVYFIGEFTQFDKTLIQRALLTHSIVTKRMFWNFYEHVLEFQKILIPISMNERAFRINYPELFK